MIHCNNKTNTMALCRKLFSPGLSAGSHLNFSVADSTGKIMTLFACIAHLDVTQPSGSNTSRCLLLFSVTSCALLLVVPAVLGSL